jgi:hypothetical protein
MKKRLALGLIPALVVGATARPDASYPGSLMGHEGTISFAGGTIAEDVEEPVNVKELDLALHLVVEAKEAEEADLEPCCYQQFSREDRGLWSKVRDLDSYPAGPGQ